jgi:hypothetical protein
VIEINKSANIYKWPCNSWDRSYSQ